DVHQHAAGLQPRVRIVDQSPPPNPIGAAINQMKSPLRQSPGDEDFVGTVLIDVANHAENPLSHREVDQPPASVVWKMHAGSVYPTAILAASRQQLRQENLGFSVFYDGPGLVYSLRFPPDGGRTMRFDKYTIKAQEAVVRSQEAAQRMDHAELTPLHLLAALLEEEGGGVVQALLQKLGANAASITQQVSGQVERLPRATGTQL